MCGILGVSCLNKNTRPMLPFLAWDMQRRGDDSWGASNGNDVIRELGAVRKSFYIPSGWVGGPVIVHTRRASQGRVNIENAHPQRIKNIIGIHNGTLNNHQELNRIHNRNYDVDTAHIFHHMADGLPLDDIGGTAALAWYDTEAPGILFLCRINTTALEVAKLTTGEIVFASEKSTVEESASMADKDIDVFYTIKPNLVYEVHTASGEIDETTKRHEFRTYSHTSPSRYSTCSTSHSTSTWLADKKKCLGCCAPLVGGFYICKKCVADNLENAKTVLLYDGKQKLLPSVDQVELVN